MYVIVCNLNMFASQTVNVFDTNDQKIVYTQTIEDENDLIPFVCAAAKKFDTNEIRISGPKSYALGYAEDIKTAYALNYGNNDINVEVI